jgi:hypothetical protein
MSTPGSLKFALPVLTLVALLVAVSGSASAQVHSAQNGTVAPRGVPASVTSFGFGGHPGFHGVPASVTSQGFGANTAFRGPVLVNPGFGVRRPIHERPGEFRHHRRVILSSPFYGGYYVPPYYDYSDSDYAETGISNEAMAQREYDARQQLENDYRKELESSREEAPAPSVATEEQPASDQPSTVLIFKDGHQAEVANYAIVGATLYDLSGGRSKKIQLAELDLPATVKENDQRGVEFQLPAQAKLN